MKQDSKFDTTTRNFYFVVCAHIFKEYENVIEFTNDSEHWFAAMVFSTNINIIKKIGKGCKSRNCPGRFL